MKSTQDAGSTPGDSAGDAANQAFHQWEKTMRGWWDQVLESPSFVGAMNQGLGNSAQATGAWREAMDGWLAQAQLPTRSDVVRTLKVATLLEERLLQQEDLLLDLSDRLARAEKDALEARIEAAEARIELREKLDALLGRRDGKGP